MNARLISTALGLVCSAAFAAGAGDADSLAGYARQSARFAPVAITVDVSALPPSERAALAKLVAASRILDDIFLRQLAPESGSRLLALAGDRSPLGAARLDLTAPSKSLACT